MMVINNLVPAKNLTADQQSVIEECAKLLEKAFGKRVYYASVTQDRNDFSKPFGVAFAFYLRKEVKA